jgi:hypothetical protein
MTKVSRQQMCYAENKLQKYTDIISKSVLAPRI